MEERSFDRTMREAQIENGIESPLADLEAARQAVIAELTRRDFSIKRATDAGDLYFAKLSPMVTEARNQQLKRGEDPEFVTIEIASGVSLMSIVSDSRGSSGKVWIDFTEATTLLVWGDQTGPPGEIKV